jgi:hypothetical protein
VVVGADHSSYIDTLGSSVLLLAMGVFLPAVVPKAQAQEAVQTDY